jgi:autotransporter-associated beta strand protein
MTLRDADGTAFDVAAEKTLSITGYFVDAISVTETDFYKTGEGTLILSSPSPSFSANTSVSGLTTGAFIVDAGTLVANSASAFGATGGGVTVNTGAALDINGVVVSGEILTLNGGSVTDATSTWDGGVVMQADSLFTIDAGDTLIIGGVISGDYALTKEGAGSLVLAGTNTYTGTTLISEGTLQLGNNTATGTVNNSNIVNNSQLVFDFSSDVDVASAISGTGTLSVVPRYELLKDWGSGASLSNSTYSVIATNSTVAEVLYRVTGGLLHGGATGSPVTGRSSGVNNKTYDEATLTGSFYLTYYDAQFGKRVKVVLRQNGTNVEAKVDSSIYEYQSYQGQAYTGADLTAEDQSYNWTGNMAYATSYASSGYGLRSLDQSVKVTLSGNVSLSGGITLGEDEYTTVDGSFVDRRFTKAAIEVGSGAFLTLTDNGISNTGSLTDAGWFIGNKGSMLLDSQSAWSFASLVTGSGSVSKTGAATLTLTGDNLYTGDTSITAGTLVIESDRVSSSTAYRGVGDLVIKPASSTFDSTFDPTTWNFTNLNGDLTLGATGSQATFQVLTLVRMDRLQFMVTGSH